jgi:hypothetical protein
MPDNSNAGAASHVENKTAAIQFRIHSIPTPSSQPRSIGEMLFWRRLVRDV